MTHITGPNLSKLCVSCLTFEFLISTRPTINYLGYPRGRLPGQNTDTKFTNFFYPKLWDWVGGD
jgi:hypothetical protein